MCSRGVTDGPAPWPRLVTLPALPSERHVLTPSVSDAGAVAAETQGPQGGSLHCHSVEGAQLGSEPRPPGPRSGGRRGSVRLGAERAGGADGLAAMLVPGPNGSWDFCCSLKRATFTGRETHRSELHGSVSLA